MFTDNEWRDNISDVGLIVKDELDTIVSDTTLIEEEDYMFYVYDEETGELLLEFDPYLFTEDMKYVIVIKADGYVNMEYVIQGPIPM